MRNAFGAAAAALILLLAGGCTPKQHPPLVVGSYNIWCGISEEGPNPWSERWLRLRDQIRFYEYDLLGMQEVRPEQLAFFRTLDEYDLLGTGREGPGQGEHMTILYRKSRLLLLDSATFWLSETPGEVSRGWDAAYNRICTWAHFQDRTTGQAFWFFNTHFDHMGEQAKLESARLMKTKIGEITAGSNLPVICTGDFNSFPGSEPIREMKALLTSARDISLSPPYNARETFRGHEIAIDPATLNVGEIDYVFVSQGVRVLKYGVLSDNNGRFYPSDHLALWTLIEWE